jgi:hypothetical protein
MPAFPNLKHEDTLRLIFAGFTVLLVAVSMAFFSMDIAVIATLLCIFVWSSLFIMHYHRETAKENVTLLKNFQDLQFLQSQLNLRKPLPYLTGWSASPALASRLYSLIEENKPSYILELGSGVSTIVMAYAIEKAGTGRLISIDHDEQYAQKTRDELKRHRLEKYASVVHAPLIETISNGTSQPWYDLSGLNGLANIDLLIVDGPPRQTCVDARLPAFEQLSGRLAPGCVVVIDDSDRLDEKNSLMAWSKSSDSQRNEDISCEKGISIRYFN